MARSKLIKFKEIELALNVIEPSKPTYNQMKGEWAEYFGNNKPIILELGCGCGEYTIGLATRNPGYNYVGVDIKGERIGNGARLATANQLSNVAFLRAQIQLLEAFFEPGEVSDIWITFPDPQPNSPKQRLTSPRFFQIYSNILKTRGTIYLKTDSKLLFEYTKEVLEKHNHDNFKINNFLFTDNLYQSQFLAEQKGIQTTFEKKYLALGQPIYFMKFEVG